MSRGARNACGLRIVIAANLSASTRNGERTAYARLKASLPVLVDGSRRGSHVERPGNLCRGISSTWMSLRESRLTPRAQWLAPLVFAQALALVDGRRQPALSLAAGSDRSRLVVWNVEHAPVCKRGLHRACFT